MRSVKKPLAAFGLWLGMLLAWELTLYTALFESPARALPAVGFLCAAAALAAGLTLLPGRWGKGFFLVLPAAGFVLFAVQTVYHQIFGSLLSVAFAGMGGNAITAFWSTTVGGVVSALPRLALLLLPLAAFYGLGRKVCPGGGKAAPALLLLAALLLASSVAALPLWGGGPADARALWTSSNATVDQWAERFGLVTAQSLDVKRLVTGGRRADLDLTPVAPEEPEADLPRNLSEALDLEKLAGLLEDPLARSCNDYLMALPGTAKNSYTGLFEGYNVIVVCAEAFSNYVIDPQLTPTLYRMSREGVVFENFYCSFPNLTTNGEYALCTGLMPDLSRMSFAASMGNYLPYCLGNVFSARGQTAMGYHNNVGTFYNRVNTHPNMGYTFRALDSGLTLTPGTPTSDLEMMAGSVEDYLGEQPFHAYYMTYSGHADYGFDTNAMSAKNRHLTEQLEGSETLRAYVACQLELEQAMALLLERLEQAGIAQKTVVVLTGDHLPYGLSEADYAQLAGDRAGEPFWQYRNSFLCWTAGLEEPVTVSDYCCTQDILPTLLNLLGVEYDSRLLTGRDVLAPGRHMAVLQDGSFLTDEVIYDAAGGEYLWQGEADEALGESLRRQAADCFTLAAALLRCDYYGQAFSALGLTEERQPVQTQASYADIAGRWYEKEVEALTARGVLSGGADGAFGGQAPASRADLTAMAARALTLSGTGEEPLPYTDVSPDRWYHGVIRAAWQAGLVEAGETFRPEEPVTWAEARELLAKAAAYAGLRRPEDWAADTAAQVLARQTAAGTEESVLTRGAAACLVAALAVQP